MSIEVTHPYEQIMDKSGRPLDNGLIYIGESGQNPEVYPIQVFYDEEFTLPAPQPIRTINGYFSRNGSPAKIFTKETKFSIMIKDKFKILQFSDLYASGVISGSGLSAADITGVVSYVDSIADLLAINNPKNGDVYDVLHFDKPSGRLKGGGTFIYDSTKSAENDGGVCLSGWVRQLENNVLNPFMFGAYGDFIPNASEVISRKSGHDDSEAFQKMYNMNKYTVFTNISKLPPQNLTKYTFEWGNQMFYLEDTLPVRSFQITNCMGGKIFFNPVGSKHLFTTPRQEMIDAYQINTGWNTQTIVGVRFTDGYITGNVTRTSNTHAKTCFDAANPYKWVLDNMNIERFECGVDLYPLDTSSWTGGNRIGNFYENELLNVSIQECIMPFRNSANVTSSTNLTVGGGVIVGATVSGNCADYYVYNVGVGSSFSGFNVAPSQQQTVIRKAVIYDACHGSSWTGGYTEWGARFLELDPIDGRFLGFKFDASHVFNPVGNIVYNFKTGVFSKFDYATGTRTLTNDGSALPYNQYVNATGIQIGATATLLENFFKFAPQYDFKYGLYGVMAPNDLNIDVKRNEQVWTGFTSKYGIRVCNFSSSEKTIRIPIANKSLNANVCILYRNITGMIADNFKLNVLEFDDTNGRITIGQDIIDYGNDWRMAVVTNKNELLGAGFLTITVPAGVQFEIEHIGAYEGGIAAFPDYVEYTPMVNSIIDRVDGNNSGALLNTGDVTKPYLAVSGGAVVDPTSVKYQYCAIQGYNSSDNIVTDTTINTVANTLLLALVTNSIKNIGVGAVINLQQSGLLHKYQVSARNFDAASGKFGLNCVVRALTGSGLAAGSALAFANNWKSLPTYTAI